MRASSILPYASSVPLFSFDHKEQLMIMLQNESEVNRERSHLTAASSVYDLTKHNGLVTKSQTELRQILKVMTELLK